MIILRINDVIPGVVGILQFDVKRQIRIRP
jgi:hypothetical protein